MRAGLAILIVVVMFGLGAWWAYQSSRPPAPRVEKPEPVRQPPRSVRTMEDGTRVQRGCELLARSIKAAISRGGAIPAETRMISLELDESGNCTIELSKEFLAVNSRGSTGESAAQNALRNALSAFDQVKTLTVLVEGSVFEGSHYGEWDHIPVGPHSSEAAP